MLNVVANGTAADAKNNKIMAELGELLNFNEVVPNKDHDYSRTAFEDYYIPDSDDDWNKGVKRSASPDWVDELIIPVVKSRREAEQVVLVSTEEESY